MALIIGHSQLKYFSEYVQDNSIQCLFSSGCTVEELATFPSVKEAVPAASVSIYKKNIYLFIIYVFVYLYTYARSGQDSALSLNSVSISVHTR